MTFTAFGFLLRIAACAAIVGIDSVIWRTPLPRPLFAICDETAHLLTAWLILTAWEKLRGHRYRRVEVALVLASAVLLDLDHIPNELFDISVLTQGTRRPYSHSGFTVMVATLAALLLPRHGGSRVAALIGCGIALHLVRDLFTGGIPLVWPLHWANIGYPHAGYLALLMTTVTLWAAAALLRGNRNRNHSPNSSSGSSGSGSNRSVGSERGHWPVPQPAGNDATVPAAEPVTTISEASSGYPTLFGAPTT